MKLIKFYYSQSATLNFIYISISYTRIQEWPSLKTHTQIRAFRCRHIMLFNEKKWLYIAISLLLIIR